METPLHERASHVVGASKERFFAAYVAEAHPFVLWTACINGIRTSGPDGETRMAGRGMVPELNIPKQFGANEYNLAIRWLMQNCPEGWTVHFPTVNSLVQIRMGGMRHTVETSRATALINIANIYRLHTVVKGLFKAWASFSCASAPTADRPGRSKRMRVS